LAEIVCPLNMFLLALFFRYISLTYLYYHTMRLLDKLTKYKKRWRRT